MKKANRRSDRLAQFIASVPVASATVFLVAIAGLGYLLAYLFGDRELLKQQMGNPPAAFQCVAAGIVGAVAMIAAFRIHVRGPTIVWRAGPLSLLAIWQILLVHLHRDVPIDKPAEQLLYGRSPECFLFILAASIPIAILSYSLLRKHRGQVSGSVAALSGLGAAALSILLMQFFQPFSMNLADVAINFAAIGIVVGGSAYAAQLQPSASARKSPHDQMIQR